jgi:hypothetical protein
MICSLLEVVLVVRQLLPHLLLLLQPLRKLLRKSRRKCLKKVKF